MSGEGASALNSGREPLGPRHRLRRLAVAALVAVLTAALLALGYATLAPGGWTVLKALLALCLALNAPWLALSAATGLVGFAVRVGYADPAAAVLPALRSVSPFEPIRLWTALAVFVRNEDIGPIEARLLSLTRDLARYGLADRFTPCVLSDTSDPCLAAAEAAAVARLRAEAGECRVVYRRRDENAGWKAGNVMDFLDRHGRRFDLMLCLDADSSMTLPAIIRMVRAMQADPCMAILQATVAGTPTAMPFARLFQFGHRSGARIWATGQAWWQQEQGAYWGHNALIRIAAFRAHARLPSLRDGTRVLSHDHVEAAKLHAAGWSVRVLPDDAGSAEAHPPSLVAYLQRDARWAAGNLQYLQLLRRRDLSVLGRLQMLQAVLHYLLSPAWFGMLPLAALLGATGEADAVPRDALLALLATGLLFLHAAKLLGYAELLLNRREAGRYGGRCRIIASILAETAFTVLLDPVLALQKTALVLGMRLRTGWARQDRQGSPLRWLEAARLFWPHTLVGLLLLTLFAPTSRFAVLLAAPAYAGLLFAIPFATLTTNLAFGLWLTRRRLAAIPEEVTEQRSTRIDATSL